MGSGDLDAKLAELKKAEADYAVLIRQISAEKKNEVNWGDYGVSDIKDLRDEAEKLHFHIEALKDEIGLATPADDLFEGLPPSDSPFVTTTLIQTEPDPKTPDVVQQPSLPPTEVFNNPGQPAAVDPIPNVVDMPVVPQPSDIQLGPQPPSDGMTEEAAFDAAATAGWAAEPLATDTRPPPPPPPTDSRRKLAIAGLAALTLAGAGVGLAVLGSNPPPVATLPPTATATAALATATAALATPTTAPTLPPVVAGPIRYASECNGDCFMEVDPVTCDRTFHFVLALLGDAATAYEGKTAIISTKGPGLQPTYEVPVVNGKVVLDAVAKGSDYGGNPNALCGANASWTGLLTSVDGKPTNTPDAPT